VSDLILFLFVWQFKWSNLIRISKHLLLTMLSKVIHLIYLSNIII